VGVLVLVASIAATLGKEPTYTLEGALREARAHNPDILIAQKKIQATRGGLVEARAGYLPSVVSDGVYRKREREGDTRLRPEDYNVNLRVIEQLYTGGANGSRMEIARLKQRKAQAELASTTAQVEMNVRLAFSELLLDRERIHVREQSVGVLRQELQSQRERLKAGTVGELNVRRAQVSVANEEPELFQARSDLQNSYLRLGELLGRDARTVSDQPSFAVEGDLIYEPRHPDLNDCLARASVNRPEVHAAQIDIAIETQQLLLDRSATRPQIEAFAGYEVYNERDPALGREFNHGYVFGLNTTWAIFDGFATRGRMEATRARREAARRALEALRLSIASEVRSAFLDLEQADHVLDAELKNVQTANESLEIAKSNLAAGLGTQLDVLQAASDLTSTQTTRLSAIYLHNAALARLDRACGGEAKSLGANGEDGIGYEQAIQLTQPSRSLGR
jgi:outer membrane protein TolC